MQCIIIIILRNHTFSIILTIQLLWNVKGRSNILVICKRPLSQASSRTVIPATTKKKKQGVCLMCSSTMFSQHSTPLFRARFSLCFTCLPFVALYSTNKVKCQKGKYFLNMWCDVQLRYVGGAALASADSFARRKKNLHNKIFYKLIIAMSNTTNKWTYTKWVVCSTWNLNISVGYISPPNSKIGSAQKNVAVAVVTVIRKVKKNNTL